MELLLILLSLALLAGSVLGWVAFIQLQSVRKQLRLVRLKVFLFDLAGLSGVLRALSFIGLGFSLVLLSWWFQRSSSKLTDAEADTVKS